MPKTRSGYHHQKKQQQNKEVGHFYHEMFIVKNKSEKEFLQNGDIPNKYKNLWYMKKSGVDHRTVALDEMARELFRLILPSHPESRIVSSNDNESYYVTSRQVLGFDTLGKVSSAEIYARCKTGEWKGLGGIMIVAVWVDEKNFRKDHLGIDHNNDIVKYDGEHCFGELQDFDDATVAYDLSSIDINQLPFLEGIYAHIWMDIIRNGKIAYLPDDTVRELRQSKYFRSDINRALMRIALLPDSLLTKFVQAYFPTSETLLNEIIHVLARRRDDLLEAAYKNQSFCKYMQTEHAKSELDSFISQIGSFTTVSKKRLLSDKDYMKLQDEMITKFERVREKTGAEPDNITEETRKKMLAIINEYIHSMAVFKSPDHKRLGWMVASKCAEHATERVAAMVKLSKLIAEKNPKLGFNECEDHLADMLLAEARIHQDSRFGEIFLEAGKYSHCIHAVKTLLDADRNRQLQMNSQARSAPAA